METGLIEFLKNLQIPEDEYYFVYNEFGRIEALHPNIGNLDIPNKIKVDREIAELIFEGIKNTDSYRVDIISKEILETEYKLESIDDVLHRIVERKWSNITDQDILISYSLQNKNLEIELNAKYYPNIWQGDTKMFFYVTEYNDPNVLKEIIYIDLYDLSKEKFVYEIDLPKKFSVYTKRLFKKYVMEIK